MELILTHDYADFDAVGAQTAASKLRPAAKPVLPPHLRRNVRAFLTMYGAHLPFIEAADVPKGKIERVLVVDTQKWQKVKGMGQHTAVEIIDHHDPMPNLKPEWNAHIEPTGAATTLIVERLRERGINLNPVEATIVLLGIYADTGSLTYGTTTARDVYAAAWAVEQGALLDVLRDYLNQPLTEAQLGLYENLLDSAETLEVAGTPVVIAAVEAPSYREDIAVVVHHLRDVLEPAALFVLVKLKRHVQFVARATEDTVHVGEVAKLFGGGGHSRAAAARLKGTLEDARRALLDALGGRIEPGVRVADLMSSGVHTLAATDRVDEAAATMARYGHEGFPVVDDAGKLVGLATRRAVDRAMGHGLEGLKVVEIMEEGALGVHPDDPLSAVRSIMIDHGWGQVPVFDEDGTLTGIITRTDLIKHQHDLDRPTELTVGVEDRLRAVLPPALMALVREAGQIAARQGSSLYAVGGFVRDLLLERPTRDIDFVVEGDAIALAAALSAQYGGRVVTHEKFGTANWHPTQEAWQNLAPGSPDTAALPDHIDFATARREFYAQPTVLPDVERSSIKLDLHRRDFTINTLAVRLDPSTFGQLLDFYGGVSDLRSGRIRALHSMSFVDDPTRMLRAVRFEQRFGFRLEHRTEHMIGRWLDLIDRVSGDRLRHEIELILAEPEPDKGLQRLHELGILQTIHPALTVDERRLAAVRQVPVLVEQPAWPSLSDSPEVDLAQFVALVAPLHPGQGEAICERLMVKKRTYSAVTRAIGARIELEQLPPDPAHSAIDAALHGLEDPELLGLAALLGEKTQPHIVTYAERLRHVRPYTDGSTLKGLGIKPGPIYGYVLHALRRAWLDGEVTSAEEEAALRDRLLREYEAETE